MSQSEWIGAAIIAGFFIFLAMKGKLATYWRLLTGGGRTADDIMGLVPVAGAASSAGSIVGGLAGAAAGPAVGSIAGTITGDGQTTATTFPMIPGGMLSLPGVKF